MYMVKPDTLPRRQLAAILTIPLYNVQNIP